MTGNFGELTEQEEKDIKLYYEIASGGLMYSECIATIERAEMEWILETNPEATLEQVLFDDR
jgi:hypothetical protein